MKREVKMMAVIGLAMKYAEYAEGLIDLIDLFHFHSGLLMRLSHLEGTNQQLCISEWTKKLECTPGSNHTRF